MAVQGKQASIDFVVRLRPEQVWEIVSDTNRMGEVIHNDKPSELLSRGTMSAKVKHHAIGEFEELPWAFQAPSFFKSTRIFAHKLLKKVEQECRLTVESDGQSTHVSVVLTVEAVKSTAGGVFLKLAVRTMQQGLDKIQKGIEDLAAAEVFVPELPMRNGDKKKLEKRCEARLVNLPKLPEEEMFVIGRIVHLIATGTSEGLARIRPYEQARKWGLDRRLVLRCFLHACRVGLLRLSWDVLCPSCAGGPITLDSLKDLPPGGHCASCDISYNVDFAEVVEATFSPEPQLRKTARALFCLGSPKRTLHWLAQFVVPARDQHSITVRLGVGRYKLQTPSMTQPLFIDVEADAQHTSVSAQLARDGSAVHISAAHEEDVYDNVEGATTSARTPHRVVLAPGSVTIHVENTDDSDRRVQLAWRSLANLAATAMDVAALGLYRDYFDHSMLGQDQQVQVGQMAILFTDLVGSTGLYEELGNAPMYVLVRRHFALLSEVVQQHQGTVVKTVGDAVMAAFELPEDAARAAIACVQAAHKMTYEAGRGTSRTLQLRAGVHIGPCLAVAGASGNVDYFGSAVNTAARVSELAQAGQVNLTHHVTRTTNVKQLLETLKGSMAVAAESATVKGMAAPLAFTRITAV